jgi:hypothetical protein
VELDLEFGGGARRRRWRAWTWWFATTGARGGVLGRGRRRAWGDGSGRWSKSGKGGDRGGRENRGEWTRWVGKKIRSKRKEKKEWKEKQNRKRKKEIEKRWRALWKFHLPIVTPDFPYKTE